MTHVSTPANRLGKMEKLLIGVAILLANRIFEDPLWPSSQGKPLTADKGHAPRGEGFCYSHPVWNFRGDSKGVAPMNYLNIRFSSSLSFL